MRKLIVFNHISLDGYFVDAEGQLSWARKGNEDEEFAQFVADNASGDGELVFGGTTYRMMASFWPTPVADQHMPVVAKRMNAMPKVVFSRTLEQAEWNNTRLFRSETTDELVAAAHKLKEEDGPGMCLLGSGNIVAQLAAAGLIDEFQMVIDPVALGKGRSMFEGLPAPVEMKLAKSRVFKNGKVFLVYEPA